MKRFLCLFMRLTILHLINASQMLEGNLIFNGFVLYDEKNLTFQEISMTSETDGVLTCGTLCLQNLQCNTAEVCSKSGSQVCRLRYGIGNIVAQGNGNSVCSSYQLADGCYGGYVDRNYDICTYNCTDCQCVLSNAAKSGQEVTTNNGGGGEYFFIFENYKEYHFQCSVYNWTVIQRRKNGSVNFNRTWIDYENGFGSEKGEMWLGLANIYNLRKNGYTVLRIDMEAKNMDRTYAEYSSFYIDDASMNYTLHVSGYSGDAGDSLTGSCAACAEGMMFSTFDRDNDASVDFSCAEYSKSGWWHRDCNQGSLNGEYGNNEYGQGIGWETFRPLTESLVAVEMKLRKPDGIL